MTKRFVSVCGGVNEVLSKKTKERNIIPLHDNEQKEPQNKDPHRLTIQSHELGRCTTQLRGFWSSPFPACSSFQACASCKSASDPSRTAHPARITNSSVGADSEALTTFLGCRAYLVVQVPPLIVLLRALPAEDGLVVNLNELPLGAVAEVSKKAAKADIQRTMLHHFTTTHIVRITKQKTKLHEQSSVHPSAPSLLSHQTHTHPSTVCSIHSEFVSLTLFKPIFLDGSGLTSWSGSQRQRPPELRPRTEAQRRSCAVSMSPPHQSWP